MTEAEERCGIEYKGRFMQIVAVDKTYAAVCVRIEGKPEDCYSMREAYAYIDRLGQINE